MAFSGDEFSRLGLMGTPRVVKPFLAKTEDVVVVINEQLAVVFIALNRKDVVHIAQESTEVVKI